jgi:hypothetical protein
MFHPLRVPLAFIAADATSLHTGLHDRRRERRLERAYTTEHSARCRAHIRAVEVQANASDLGLDVVLAEAGVGTRRAALRAVVTGLDAADEDTGIHGWLRWVTFHHLPGVSHRGSSLEASQDALVEPLRSTSPCQLEHRRSLGRVDVTSRRQALSGSVGVLILPPGAGLGGGPFRRPFEQKAVVGRDERVRRHHRVRVVDGPILTREGDPAWTFP